MAFADWFRPKWKHSNPVVRTAAVKATTDQAILGQVATNDADANVRIAAVEALTDEKVLCEVAKGDTDDNIRFELWNNWAAAQSLPQPLPIDPAQLSPSSMICAAVNTSASSA